MTVRSDHHIAGVSVNDRYYHRKEFRDACTKLGLECRYLNGRYGWTLTDWPETGVPERYRQVLRLLATLPFGSGGGIVQRVEGRPAPESGHVRLWCRCEPVRTVHVTRTQAGRGGIRCTFCQSDFRALAAQAAAHAA